MAARCRATARRWRQLPGVGRKTANVVLNVAFGESTMAVDTHIFRLGNRTGIAPGATPRAVEDALVRRVPAGAAARRASLADPARALRVQGARAGVLALRGRRMVQVSRQDPTSCGEAAPREVMRALQRYSITALRMARLAYWSAAAIGAKATRRREGIVARLSHCSVGSGHRIAVRARAGRRASRRASFRDPRAGFGWAAASLCWASPSALQRGSGWAAIGAA